MKHIYKFESFLNESMQDRDLENFADSLEMEIDNLHVSMILKKVELLVNKKECTKLLNTQLQQIV